MGLLFGKTTYKVFVSQMDKTIIFIGVGPLIFTATLAVKPL